MIEGTQAFLQKQMDIQGSLGTTKAQQQEIRQELVVGNILSQSMSQKPRVHNKQNVGEEGDALHEQKLNFLVTCQYPHPLCLKQNCQN